MSDSARSTRPTEIRSLIGARGLPALFIVLFHFAESSGYWGVPVLDRFVLKSYLWVEFFFAASGFILAYVYGQRMGGRFDGRATRAFFIARFARLYPLHLAVIVILFVLSAALGQLFPTPVANRSWDLLIGNLLLVQAWNVFDTLGWNAPAWFVSAKAALYLLFPALILIVARLNLLLSFVLVVIGLAGLLALTTYMPASAAKPLDFTHHWGVLRGLCSFAAGLALGQAFRIIGAGQLSWTAHSLTQIGAIALWLVALYVWRNDVAIVAAMLLLLWTLAFDRGVVAGALSTRPMLWLGEISYAIYIVQYVFTQLLRLARRNYPDDLTAWKPMLHNWIEPAALILAVVLAGWLLQRTIEKPVGDWLRARLMRLFVRPAAA